PATELVNVSDPRAPPLDATVLPAQSIVGHIAVSASNMLGEERRGNMFSIRRSGCAGGKRGPPPGPASLPTGT
ncbi:MAG: hypothetical protein OK454_06265, partial [Thaumarchaeota archaeon]|nr:hypothetical protein [Nitrososphaerota archaeon]